MLDFLLAIVQHNDKRAVYHWRRDPWDRKCQSRFDCDAPVRRPQRTSTVETMIATLTLRNPAATRLSCQGWALRPAVEIGENAAVPKTAASVVTSQFT